jgi:putative spermidine/putrescine transport system permease protein
VVITSLKDPSVINLASTWQLPTTPHWQSFQEVLTAFGPRISNSVTLVISATILSSIMGSLNGINPHFESAAMSLGADRMRTFLYVLLPLCLPGIAGGFLLVFSIAISAYATPAILGGPATQVAATAIYNFIIQLLDWSLGAALAVILIAATLLLLYGAGRLGERRAAL